MNTLLGTYSPVSFLPRTTFLRGPYGNLQSGQFFYSAIQTIGKPNLGIVVDTKNGKVVGGRTQFVTMEFPDTVRYRQHKITAVDGSIRVLYKWHLCPFGKARDFHFIESSGPY